MGKEFTDLLQCSWHRALAQDMLRTRNGRSVGKLTKSDYEWKGHFSSVELLRKPLTSWQFLHLAAPGLSGKRRARERCSNGTFRASLSATFPDVKQYLEVAATSGKRRAGL